MTPMQKQWQIVENFVQDKFRSEYRDSRVEFRGRNSEVWQGLYQDASNCEQMNASTASK